MVDPSLTGTLLQTKLFAPAPRPELVERPALIARLNAGLAGRLTLLSAPAGFGKTTLLLDWLARQRSHTSCWLALDSADNDPIHFITYFVAALQTADPTLGHTVLASLQAPQPPPLTHLCTRLLNELAARPAPLLVVLDDYHLIEQRAVHDLLAFCLEHLPSTCHLVLASRVDPPFSLARWRAQGALSEIREQDLRLDLSETAVFLNDLMALDLPDASIRLIYARTEGWVASLQLVALALRGQSAVQKQAVIDQFGGSHMFVMDYFLEEVWVQVEAPVRVFLMETAVLDQLTGPLCDAVTGQTGSRSRLDALYRQNLFLIPLDQQRRWYRYHHLFKELLLNQLRRGAAPADIAALHVRAGTWFAAHGSPDAAIRHFLAGRAYDRAAALILQHARNTQKSGRLNTLLRWINALPPEVRTDHPHLLVFQGQALHLSGQLEAAEHVLFDAQAVVATLPASPENRILRGELAVQLAIIASIHDDSTRIIAHAEEALALLPPTDLANRARAISMLGVAYGYAGDTERLEAACREATQLAQAAGHPFLQAHALQLRGSTQVHHGRLHAAVHSYQQVIALPGPSPDARPPYAGLGLIGLADVQLERHALADAARNLADGIALCQQGGIGYVLLNAYCTELRLRQAQNDAPAARATFEQMARYLEQNRTLPLGFVQWAVAATRYHLWQEDLAAATHALAHPYPDDTVVDLPRLPVVVREVYLVAQAQICLARRQWEQVLMRHDDILATAQPSGRYGRVLEAALLAAVAHLNAGSPDQALASLATALAIAAPEGHVQQFLERGPQLGLLLARYAGSSANPGALRRYARSLAAQFDLSATAPAGSAQSAMIETLSSREREVLNLLAQGYSNRQIAVELVVSLNTVKKHASNIYGKLGVHGRTQAIARARDLDLI